MSSKYTPMSTSVVVCALSYSSVVVRNGRGRGNRGADQQYGPGFPAPGSRIRNDAK
jgi:hypothetical protein